MEKYLRLNAIKIVTVGSARHETTRYGTAHQTMRHDESSSQNSTMKSSSLDESSDKKRKSKPSFGGSKLISIGSAQSLPKAINTSDDSNEYGSFLGGASKSTSSAPIIFL